MTICYRLIILSGFVVACLNLAASSRITGMSLPEQVPNHRESDALCGSRCVHFLLQYYGYRSNIYEIVHELQYPDPTVGASVGDIQRLLRRAGVNAQTLSVPAGYTVTWEHPCVAYLKVADALGHFAIITNDAAAARAHWDGIMDVWQPDDPRLCAQPYVVLFTAPTAFSVAEAQSSIRYSCDRAAFAFGTLVAIGSLLAMIQPFKERKRP